MKPSAGQLFTEIHDLASRCLEGSATAADREALGRLVKESAGARAVYVEYMEETSLLRWQSAAPDCELLRDLGGEAAEAARPGWRLVLAAAAGGILAAALLLAITLAERVSSDVAGAGVATLTRLDNVRWGKPETQRWRELSRLTLGDVVRFESGEVEIVFDHGVEVVISGPAHFEVRAADRAFSNLGRIAARVGEDGQGFTLETPVAKVVDLGTEFAVEVTPDGLTDVAVFDGLVDLSVNAEASDRPARRLSSGEALRIDSTGKLGRLMTIPSDRFPVPRSRPTEGRSNPLILDVRDNSPADAGTKFYQIVRTGLAEDSRAYVDRPHEWNGVERTGMPPFLVGSEYVMPFNDDKFAPTLELSVQLARPAMLYVLLSDSVPAPDWLQRDFVDTGFDVGLDEGKNRFIPSRRTAKGPGRSIDTTFSIWSRRIEQASVVRLGGIERPADPPGFNMYGIAAAPLADQAPFRRGAAAAADEEEAGE